ncbi:MAG: 23S rRNA (pseudouridine(1915)-N(3))-methyltransferase RlmH [Rikenellaceae bacterium]|nr:23S rRNA (pseudouridine(1915)-N(3))-methyltransferase RlmH [Rikenellaceae bacterium]
MKILLLLVGKNDTSWLRNAVETYEERLSHYADYKRVELPELKGVSGMSQQQIKEKEGEMILKNVKLSDTLILLDERGSLRTSEEFARYIEKYTVSGTRNIIFVVGGAYGFSEKVYQRADDMISLSRMTFPHQMVRLVFLEQLYRAHTIIKGEPYHHK